MARCIRKQPARSSLFRSGQMELPLPTLRSPHPAADPDQPSFLQPYTSQDV